jgi:2-aminoadipate transaminase
MISSLIDFGKGQPSLSLLPTTALQHSAEHFVARRDPLWLRYGDDQGEAPFLNALAEFLTRRYAAPVNASQLMATCGNSQALSLCCTRFTKPGDTIFVEAPTYFLALDIFRDHGLRVVGIPIDDEGMQMPALHDALAAHRPSMLYTIPSFQNPTGVTLSASRREQLLAACAAHEVLVVADEVYQLLDFGAPPPPSLATYASDARVLSLGSFSKICAPGLRLGWVHGAPALLEQLMNSGLVQSGGGLNPFTSGVVHSLITLGLADRVLDDLKLVYAERSRVLCEALRDAIPDARFVEPSGGYFVWVQLPGVSAVELLPAARDAGVSFHAGPRFATDDQFGDTLRLSFAHYDSDRLRDGVERLARARRSFFS